MRKTLVAALVALSVHAADAQTAPVADTSYTRKLAASADLYYGIEHLGYAFQMNGTPYFDSNDWQKGTVTYNNVLHNDVMLKYDLITDELVALHPNGFFQVTLIADRIQSFTIGHQEFVYVPKNNRAGLKQPGFYHVLAAGKLTILVKRSKVIEEKTSVHGVERNIVSKQQYYSLKDGAANNVSSEESVMGLLGEHARQVRSHLRSREIKFRKHKELALLEIATYYNQLAK